jgi:hypothetical protein
MTSTVVFPANFPLTLHERAQAPDVLRANVGVAMDDLSLVTEFVSKRMKAIDFFDRLCEYQQLTEVKQILFVSQKKPFVISYVRSEQPDVWLNTRFHALTDAVVVLDKPVLLSTIYRKVRFD